MRVALLLTLAISLILAGCTSPSATDTTGTDAMAPPVDRILPEPIEDTQTVQGSADPTNFVGLGVCTAPTAKCVRYPFEVTSTTSLAADLTWGVASNDFDLYVFSEGAPITSDGGQTPPGTSERVAIDLDPGAYELVVVPWGVTMDTFTVKAVFS